MAKKATPQTKTAKELTDTINFEAALEELETLVGQMESGDLGLDESLKAFERGVFLTRQCQTALKNAELKVQTLTQDGDLIDLDVDNLDDT
ncbi:MAG: exodeoxyribonuclease VII small subunit [Gammaproteobacteria bacterium]|nr:exodeoxyribonuclease VII small subunit [Gammaproteobacteria bacterium]